MKFVSLILLFTCFEAIYFVCRSKCDLMSGCWESFPEIWGLETQPNVSAKAKIGGDRRVRRADSLMAFSLCSMKSQLRQMQPNSQQLCGSSAISAYTAWRASYTHTHRALHVLNVIYVCVRERTMPLVVFSVREGSSAIAESHSLASLRFRVVSLLWQRNWMCVWKLLRP